MMQIIAVCKILETTLSKIANYECSLNKQAQVEHKRFQFFIFRYIF